jgi:hypothetical protein
LTGIGSSISTLSSGACAALKRIEIQVNGDAVFEFRVDNPEVKAADHASSSAESRFITALKKTAPFGMTIHSLAVFRGPVGVP